MAFDRIRLSIWARQQGISRATAYRMLRRGILPVPAEQSPTGRWYVTVHAERIGRSAIYARAAPSRAQVNVLNSQISAITEWAAARHRPVFTVVTEIADPLADRMPRLARLLADVEISEIVIHDPDVLGIGRMELIVAALAPQGRVITSIRNRRPVRERNDELYAAVSALTKALRLGPVDRASGSP